jgi:hypothetical protein
MKTILAALITLVIALLAGILALQIYFISAKDAAAASTLFEMTNSIKEFGWSLWVLVQPILQLALLLAVLLFFFNSSGLAQRLLAQQSSGNAFNTQSAIALLIIGGFVIAALTRTEAAAQLKEIALVVVGFYFGTRQRRGEGDGAEAAAAVNAGPSTGPGRVGAPTPPASGSPLRAEPIKNPFQIVTRPDFPESGVRLLSCKRKMKMPPVGKLEIFISGNLGGSVYCEMLRRAG